MKPLFFVGKILFILLVVLAAMLSPDGNRLFDVLSIVFVLGTGAGMALMSFSFPEIFAALRRVATPGEDENAIRKAVFFWETMARNFLLAGIVGTLLGYILMLGRMDDPKMIGPQLGIAFITTLYGVFLAVLCGIPAMVLAKRLTGGSNDEKTATQPETGGQGSIVTRVIGYAVFLAVFVLGADLANNWDMFVDWPSLLLVCGGAIAFVLVLGDGGAGQAFSQGFVFTGLFGGLMGLVQLLNNLANPKGLGPAMAFALLSSLAALLGMMMVGIPMEDRDIIKKGLYRRLALNRVAWYGFPLLVLIILGISIALLMFIFSNVIIK